MHLGESFASQWLDMLHEVKKKRKLEFVSIFLDIEETASESVSIPIAI